MSNITLKGRDLMREGGDIIREACKWSPELTVACDLWKEIKFEFERSEERRVGKEC